MSLAVGTRIGVHAVTGSLGAGGMGEVYRARDTTLDRDVALKVLPDALTADPDRRARFEREARILASLNHPNIAQIYGTAEADDVRALVLELVEGATLAERIAQGPLPLEDALAIARQIAVALRAAHEAGVVHRDLKPANVVVREDGAVKVLDFGLAKALDAAPAMAAGAGEPATVTTTATRMGVILGTPSYMSPEQASGASGVMIDTRADLWALGVVLYEMLTGERLFDGETAPQALARVLGHEPDLSVLPPATPAPVMRLLRRCLERDLRRRMRDAGEAISDLEAACDPSAENDTGFPAAGSAFRRWWPRVAGAAALVAIGVVLAAAFGAIAPSPPSPGRHLALALPSAMASESAFAVAPDGSALVYVDGGGETRRLVMRRLDRIDTQPLPGTEGALDPFFSPDGEWVAFFAASRPASPTDRLHLKWALKRVPVGGGPAVTLVDSFFALGGSWGDDDRIVLGGIGGLLRVPAAGGAPEAVPMSDTRNVIATYASPHVLPGSRAILFARTAPRRAPDLRVLSLATGEQRVVAAGTRGSYTPTGHLLFLRSTRPEQAAAGVAPLNLRRDAPGDGGPGTTTVLMAAPFDAEGGRLTGAPIPLEQDVGGFAWAADGAFVYTRSGGGHAAARELVWVDRTGREEPLSLPPAAYDAPRISPDGDRVALESVVEPGRSDILIHDLARGTSSPMTFEGALDLVSMPVWSSDGRRIVFSSDADDGVSLFRKAADGTGAAERLTPGGAVQAAQVWAHDADALVLVSAKAGLDFDLNLLPMAGERTPVPLIATPFAEVYADLAPDERWIAYQSNESGIFEVYVRPFPNVADGKWQISQGGGVSAAWSSNGRELFYRGDYLGASAMMAVEYTTDPTFTPSPPERLFDAPYRVSAFDRARPWDFAPSGDRFLMIKEGDRDASERGPTDLVYVSRWFDELRARVPAQ